MAAPSTGAQPEHETKAPKEAPWFKKPTFKKLVVVVAFLLVITLAVIVLGIFFWKKQRAPNIIIFLVDDMGWSDVSFHGNGQIPTPNIDAMCSDAVLLNSHYVQPSCTPSRAALLTGKYPIKLGLQEFVIVAGREEALDTSHKLLPQYLRELGYSTHLVGKWHLGFYADKYLPQNRGFDSFYGYYNGAGSYYNHTCSDGDGRLGYDWHSGYEVDRSAEGGYATDLITQRAKDLIKAQDPEKPMFLMISHMAPHGGDQRDLFEVDKEWVDDPAIEHIRHPNRTLYAGMLRAVDDALGQTFAALDEADMLDNTVILFSSDNGGPSIRDRTGYPTGASNWPLRGQKFSMWEGGVRVASFLWSPLLKSQRYVNRQAYHITDWLPTFYKLAGGKDKLPEDLDGHDIWDSVNHNTDSPRNSILINYDTGGKESFAVRRGNFKLMHGTPPKEGRYDSWYATAGGTMDDFMELQKAMKGSTAYAVLSKRPSFEERRNNWREAGKVKCAINRGMASSPHGSEFRVYTVDEMHNASKIRTDAVCRDSDKEPCLFDLLNDPCELRQYSGPDRSRIIEELTEIANKYIAVTKPAKTPWVKGDGEETEKEADPANFCGNWVPWTTYNGTCLKNRFVIMED